MFAAVVEPRARAVMALVTLLVTALQLLAFPFALEWAVDNPFRRVSLLSPARATFSTTTFVCAVRRFLRLFLLDFDLSPGDLTIPFVVAAALGLVAIAMVLVSYRFKGAPSGSVGARMWYISVALAYAVSTFAFIPLLRLLLAVLVCYERRDGDLVATRSQACWAPGYDGDGPGRFWHALVALPLSTMLVLLVCAARRGVAWRCMAGLRTCCPDDAAVFAWRRWVAISRSQPSICGSTGAMPWSIHVPPCDCALRRRRRRRHCRTQDLPDVTNTHAFSVARPRFSMGEVIVKLLLVRFHSASDSRRMV